MSEDLVDAAREREEEAKRACEAAFESWDGAWTPEKEIAFMDARRELQAAMKAREAEKEIAEGSERMDYHAKAVELLVSLRGGHAPWEAERVDSALREAHAAGRNQGMGEAREKVLEATRRLEKLTAGTEDVEIRAMRAIRAEGLKEAVEYIDHIICSTLARGKG